MNKFTNIRLVHLIIFLAFTCIIGETSNLRPAKDTSRLSICTKEVLNKAFEQWTPWTFGFNNWQLHINNGYSFNNDRYDCKIDSLGLRNYLMNSFRQNSSCRMASDRASGQVSREECNRIGNVRMALLAKDGWGDDVEEIILRDIGYHTYDAEIGILIRRSRNWYKHTLDWLNNPAGSMRGILTILIEKFNESEDKETLDKLESLLYLEFLNGHISTILDIDSTLSSKVPGFRTSRQRLQTFIENDKKHMERKKGELSRYEETILQRHLDYSREVQNYLRNKKLTDYHIRPLRAP